MTEKVYRTKLKQAIASNRNLSFIILSLATILIIFLNLTRFHSTVIGTIAFGIYLSINGIFLGHTLFGKEGALLRLVLGFLSLVVLLGLVGWLAVIIYNLDTIFTILTLSIVAALTLLIGAKHKKAQRTSSPQNQAKRRNASRLFIVKLLYVCTIIASFYLLYISRTGEIYTVWQAIHPLFIPTFFATTLLLLIIILSPEKDEYKLLFVIIHSILSHTFFVVIFPAGDVGYQARILADTRTIFNNTIVGGWPPWPVENLFSQMWHWFRGVNFQSALSVIFARTFFVDVLWTHLLLLPILWGTFTTVAVFLVTRMLCRNEKAALLSGLLISLFPTNIYYGAISVPNSLGFIFFFFSIFFMMKYLSSGKSINLFSTFLFSFVSFLSHFLTGIMAFSLLLIAITLRRHEYKKQRSPVSEKISLLTSFIFCASVIPFALVYQRLFHAYGTRFALDKLYGLPLYEVIQRFILGEYVNYWYVSRIFHIIPPLLGFAGIIFYWRVSLRQPPTKSHRLYFLFLLMSFLVVLFDYRITKLFMVHVPFNEERLWVFRDFIAAPFVAIIAEWFFDFLWRKTSNVMNSVRPLPLHHLSKLLKHVSLKSIFKYFLVSLSLISYFLLLFSLPAAIATSIYYGYPRYGPLQTTSYELEAVNYIDKNTDGNYVVIGDAWINIAGQMFAGVYNRRAYYFEPRSSQGIALFIKMRENPTNETMIEAMKTNNATTAYFIIEKPRLGTEEYNRVIQQAEQNNLKTYKIFHYQGEEKLRIFYYKQLEPQF